MAVNTEKLSHTGAELDRAVAGWLNTLIPAYTLPEQVTFKAALDPTVPQVHLYWAWENTENAGGIMIRRKLGSLPEHSGDGELVCNIEGTETTTFDDVGFDKDDATQVGTMAAPVEWHYRAFPYNVNLQNQTHYQTTVNLGVISVNVYFLEASTTLASIALGGDFVFGKWNSTQLIWRVANIQEDRAQVILATNFLKITAQFDEREPNNPNTDRNNGNNIWSLSNIRQWLNADGAAGEWYVESHDYDACSTTTKNRMGFLHEFTEAEKGIIIPETHTMLLPNIDGGGTETVVDTVWLPSRDEMGLGSENSNYPEGSVFQLFDGDLNTNANRADGWNVVYWLRTANASFANYARYVAAAGSLSNNYVSANNSYAVRAGLTIPLSTILSYNEETGYHEVVAV